MRILVSTAVAALVSGTALAAGAAAGTVTPVVTGCPAGYSLFAVGTPPYQVPGLLDDRTNGGNGDGWVCAHALPDAVRDAFCANGRSGCLLQQEGLTLYEFIEDTNPAGAHVGG